MYDLFSLLLEVCSERQRFYSGFSEASHVTKIPFPSFTMLFCFTYYKGETEMFPNLEVLQILSSQGFVEASFFRHC